MKDILFTNLPPEISENLVIKSLEPVGPVSNVRIIRDGNPNQAVVVVSMNISDSQAFQLVSRVKDYWFHGRRINAHLLMHR